MNSDASSMDSWESHCYEGFFSIDLPVGIRSKQEDDGSMLTFPLPTNPASEIIAGVFPTPGNESVTPLVIRSEIKRYMSQSVGLEKASYETPADFDKEGFVAYQGVAVDASGRWWLARLYGRQGGRTMLLVHWVGQESDLHDHVLPVFVSIDPVLNEQPGATQ